MRPYLLAAAVALAAFPVSADAAATCWASVSEPRTSGAIVEGTGTYSCTYAAPGMTLTVCVEALRVPGGWAAEGCTTKAANGATTVTADAWACVQSTGLVRIAAYGTNAEGGTASSVGVPALAPGAGSCGP